MNRGPPEEPFLDAETDFLGALGLLLGILFLWLLPRLLGRTIIRKAVKPPVLKHGPRSSSYMQVWFIEVKNAKRKRFPSDTFPVAGSPVGLAQEHVWWDPKDGDLYLDGLKSEEILMEGLPRCWRANRSFELGIGAKDSSNHLVAGCSRNIPQNSSLFA